MVDHVLADADALEVFACQVFLELGLSSRHAQDAARVLVWASLRGVDTHGIRNLGSVYARMIDEGHVDPRATFAVEHETPFSVRANGGSGLGMAAGVWAMNLAIEKARTSGAGMVAMRNSRHYGAAGFYPAMALAHDMIGVCMTGRFMPRGTPIGLVPTFAALPMFSTNPLAFAAPTLEEPPFLLDMATTIAPYNRVMLYQELGLPLPAGWAVDEAGAPSTDPLHMNRLLPLGGTREMGSHKGYGLAMVVQILSGVLSGSWSAGCESEDDSFDGFGQADDGHFFAAMRIDAFQPADDFKRAMDAMIRALHASPKQAGQERIYVAGEIEHENEVHRRKHGIPIPPNVQADLKGLAERFGLELPY